MNSISDFINDAIHERNSLALKYTTPQKPILGGMLGFDRWEVYSPLIRKDITLYGLREYRNWILLEADYEVLGFCPQPVWMLGRYQGVEGKSLPDFYVLKTGNNEEFQEIKRQKDLDNIENMPELKRQITIQRQWCLMHNVRHVVRSEVVIEEKPFLIENWGSIINKCTLTRNVNFISKMSKVVTALMLAGEDTIRDITVELGSDSEFVISHLFHLKLVEFLCDNERMTWVSKVRLSSKWQ